MSESNHRTSVPTTYLEPAARHEPMAKEETPRFNTPVIIRVISYRKRKHDTDGVSLKAVLDGIIKAGILTDDSSEEVRQVIFESRKSKTEKTIIEIISLDEAYG